MSSLRHLWFDTRHLLGDEPGQALLADLQALPSEARETILTTGDRLAEVFTDAGPSLLSASSGRLAGVWRDGLRTLGSPRRGSGRPGTSLARRGGRLFLRFRPNRYGSWVWTEPQNGSSSDVRCCGSRAGLGRSFFKPRRRSSASCPAGHTCASWAEQGRLLPQLQGLEGGVPGRVVFLGGGGRPAGAESRGNSGLGKTRHPGPGFRAVDVLIRVCRTVFRP